MPKTLEPKPDRICNYPVEVESDKKCVVCGYPTYPQGACNICPNCGTSTGCSWLLNQGRN